MLKTFKVLLSGLFVLSIFGCKNVDIENGMIPDEYLGEASKFVGSYDGNFKGQAGTITVALHGNHMALTFAGANGGNDLLPGCRSVIGDLTQITVSEKSNGNYELKRATFAFDPNLCSEQVQGRHLYLDIKVKNEFVRLSASVLDYTQMERRCRYEPPSYPGGGGRRVCDWVRRYHYLQGRFSN